ncbi:MAG: SMP-30/gluconolactonase/LRE family protein [Acidobacteria bacterium]|nr:SMP-30/gluconolactonase/LRE family protein [Acidobacteriota bacterium]
MSQRFLAALGVFTAMAAVVCLVPISAANHAKAAAAPPAATQNPTWFPSRSPWGDQDLQVEVAAHIWDVSGNLEGPTADADGNIYFTDAVAGNRIFRLGTDGTVSLFRQPANRAPGLVFDAQFRLIAAEFGDPATNTPGRITRTDLKTGKVEVLADSYQGTKLKDLNDVTFDGRGRIYFTYYGTDPLRGVYRIDTDGKLTRIVSATDVDTPNGLMVSPDDRTLYVIEANQTQGGRRAIRAFDLSPEGNASNPRVFHNFYPGRSGDGGTVDSEGNVWIAAGLNGPRGKTYCDPPIKMGCAETLDTKAGVHVFSPAGVLLKFIPITQDTVTNIAFGGPDLKTVYVTAGNTLYKFRSKIAGTRR